MKIRNLVECHRHGYKYIVTHRKWNRVIKEIIMMIVAPYSTIVDINTCTCTNTTHIITHLCSQFTSMNICTGVYMHKHIHMQITVTIEIWLTVLTIKIMLKSYANINSDVWVDCFECSFNISLQWSSFRNLRMTY